MATFEGQDKSTLPELLQRFLIPVYTTAFPGTIHIHTAPTWQGVGAPQWVIACPFDAGELHLNRRWNDGDGTGPTNYTVSPDFLMYLDDFDVGVASSFKNELPCKLTQEVEEFKVALRCQSPSEKQLILFLDLVEANTNREAIIHRWNEHNCTSGRCLTTRGRQEMKQQTHDFNYPPRPSHIPYSQ